MIIRQVRAELFHEDRRTDRLDEAITKAPEKVIRFETLTAVVDQFMVFFFPGFLSHVVDKCPP